jgi:hypothetical protein
MDLLLISQSNCEQGQCAWQVLPPWLTTVLLAALLVLLSSKLIHRGIVTYRSESRAQRAAAGEAAELGAAAEAPLLGDGGAHCVH